MKSYYQYHITDLGSCGKSYVDLALIRKDLFYVIPLNESDISPNINLFLTLRSSNILSCETEFGLGTRLNYYKKLILNRISSNRFEISILESDGFLVSFTYNAEEEIYKNDIERYIAYFSRESSSDPYFVNIIDKEGICYKYNVASRQSTVIVYPDEIKLPDNNIYTINKNQNGLILSINNNRGLNCIFTYTSSFVTSILLEKNNLPYNKVIITYNNNLVNTIRYLIYYKNQFSVVAEKELYRNLYNLSYISNDNLVFESYNPIDNFRVKHEIGFEQGTTNRQITISEAYSFNYYGRKQTTIKTLKYKTVLINYLNFENIFYFDKNYRSFFIVDYHQNYYSNVYNNDYKLLSISKAINNKCEIVTGNLVNNGFFSGNLNGWTTHGNANTILVVNNPDFSHTGFYCMEISTNNATNSGVYQEINIDGKHYDVFTFSCLIEEKYNSNIQEKSAKIVLSAYLNSMSRCVKEIPIDLTNDLEYINNSGKWYIVSNFFVGKIFDKVKIDFIINGAGSSYTIDAVQFFKEKSCIDYIYDEDGNAKEIDCLNYIISRNVKTNRETNITQLNDCSLNKGAKIIYKYDDTHRLIEKLLPYCFCETYKYDDNGDLIEVKTISPTNRFLKRIEYLNRYPFIDFNENKETIFTYNDISMTIRTILTSDETTTRFEYNDFQEKISCNIINNNENYYLDYLYNEGHLLDRIIDKSNTVYKYSYDNSSGSYGKILSIGVQNKINTTYTSIIPLVKYNYLHEWPTHDSSKYYSGLIKTKQFGDSGDTIIYDYDNKDKLISISIKNKDTNITTLLFSFTYDYFDRVSSIIDNRTTPHKTITYEYEVEVDENKIKSINDGNGNSILYRYNNIKELVNKKCNYRGLNLLFEYSNFNRLLSNVPALFYDNIKYPEEDEFSHFYTAFFDDNSSNNYDNLRLIRYNDDRSIDEFFETDCEYEITYDELVPVVKYINSSKKRLVYTIGFFSMNVASIMFWFKPTQEIIDESELMIFGEIGGLRLVAKILANHKIRLDFINDMYHSTHVLLTTINTVEINKYNFFGLSFNFDFDNNQLNVVLNERTYTIATSVIGISGFMFKLAIGTSLENPRYGLNMNISSIIYNPYEKLNANEIKKIYEDSKEYLFRSLIEDDSILMSNCSSIVLYDETLLNNYHVIPLHNNFEETNGTKPIMIFLNNKINNPYDSESYFVFDDDIKRKIYNAKDNIVGYFTDMANSGVVAMNVKFNEEKVDDQTIFSLINSYSQIELYANGTSLYFKFCNDEPRSVINNIDLSKWHFIAFSWTRVDLSPSIGPDYFIMQVYFDNTIVTYNINRTNDFTSFDLFIGTRMITLTPCKNFNGKLEMVTFNNIYHTIAMMNILKDKLKLSQLTRIYENNSLLRKLELKVKDNFIINNEYIYDTYNILENNVSRKYNTSKIKSEIISTLNYSSHLNYEYYEPNAFGIENVKSIYSQTLNKFIAKYEYNTRNFLTKEVFDDGTSVDYTYDYFGNVTSRNYTNPNISDTYFEYNHTYKGLLTKVTKGSEVKTITYQNEYLGNPKTITYGHYVINLYYEISNLIKYEYIDTQYSSNNYVIEYKYNHHNLIIEKKVNNVITNYYYEEERLILEETGNNRKYYLYDNIGLLYGIIINNNKYYYLKDMLNNIIGLVAEDGNCCVRYKYDSFGSVIAIEGDAAFTIGIENPIRYKGYYYDKDIRLYYCKSRFYNHEWGRWLSADEINYINPDSINGLNLFNYCDNNPVMYTDPNGNFFFSTLIIGSVVGGIVGAGVSAITQGISNGWDKINGWQVLLDGAIGAFNGALATSGIGSVASKIISGALGVAGSVGGDLINSNGNWNEINWGKAAILGAVNVGLAIFGGSNSQDATKLGKELLKNKEVSSKFSVLFNAVNDYASGTISKRGMTGIFNLYGKQFANAVTKNMHGLVAKLTTHSLGFSSLTTIATSFFGIVLK